MFISVDALKKAGNKINLFSVNIALYNIAMLLRIIVSSYKQFPWADKFRNQYNTKSIKMPIKSQCDRNFT